jgi:hypothetical protein
MFDELKRKVMTLSDKAWERRLDWPSVEQWLSNFTGKFATEEQERLHALYLLTQTMYFGQSLIREMLRSVYLNLYRYPLIIQTREDNGGTLDTSIIETQFTEKLKATRFLGVGNPSESGPHLLYYFRQINNLAKDLFIDSGEILSISKAADGATSIELRHPTVERYVFIDDLLGSATQIRRYLPDILREIRSNAPHVEVHYFALFATSAGLIEARSPDLFGGNVGCIFELDPTFKCFGDHSRSFTYADGPIQKVVAESIAKGYGSHLSSDHPLGYKDGQLLLALSHNTPDNSLPILWFDFPKHETWVPIFKRFDKIYS